MSVSALKKIYITCKITIQTFVNLSTYYQFTLNQGFIMIEVNEALSLPRPKDDYQIKICVQELDLITLQHFDKFWTALRVQYQLM